LLELKDVDFVRDVALMNRWQPTPTQQARASERIDLLGIDPLAGAPWTTVSQGERPHLEPAAAAPDEPTTGPDHPMQIGHTAVRWDSRTTRN
jgi:hypothetical protein